MLLNVVNCLSECLKTLDSIIVDCVFQSQPIFFGKAGDISTKFVEASIKRVFERCVYGACFTHACLRRRIYKIVKIHFKTPFVSMTVERQPLIIFRLISARVMLAHHFIIDIAPKY